VSCGAPVSPFHIIPIAGYFIAKGKCPSCGARFSPAYPAAEILSGTLMVLTAYTTGISPVTLCDYLFIMTVLSAAVTDMKSMTIPHTHIILAIILSIYPVADSGEWLSALGGMLLLGIIFFLIIIVFPGGFGGGDLKLAAVIGFFLHFDHSIVALEGALVIGSVIGVAYALITRKGLRIRIPFAPFLAIGLLVAYFFGDKILMHYYGLF
jgi:leader peptidase (prepilin peptidase)/N-methyltransferase